MVEQDRVCHTYREPSGSGATDGTTGLADRVEPVPNQIPTRRSISSRDADLSSTMSGTCGHTAAQMSVIAQSEWSCLFDRLADLDCRPLGVRHRMAAVKRHVTTRAAPRTQERGAGIEPASAAWCAAVLTVGLSPQPLSSLLRAVPRPTQASGQPRDRAPCPSCGHRRPRIVAPSPHPGTRPRGRRAIAAHAHSSPNASRRQPRLTDRSVGQSR
jgi:hypothetical protein